MTLQEYLEAIMLGAFSVGWYFSIAKMIRTGQAGGKSLGFVGLVCFGYLCGASAKIIGYINTGALSNLIYIYAWNLAVTFADGVLVRRYSSCPRVPVTSTGRAASQATQGDTPTAETAERHKTGCDPYVPARATLPLPPATATVLANAKTTWGKLAP